MGKDINENVEIINENDDKEEKKTVCDRLLTVKSITTLLLAAVFAFLAIRGDITGQQFIEIFAVIIAFYFGVQTSKGKE